MGSQSAMASARWNSMSSRRTSSPPCPSSVSSSESWSSPTPYDFLTRRTGVGANEAVGSRERRFRFVRTRRPEESRATPIFTWTRGGVGGRVGGGGGEEGRRGALGGGRGGSAWGEEKRWVWGESLRRRILGRRFGEGEEVEEGAVLKEVAGEELDEEEGDDVGVVPSDRPADVRDRDHPRVRLAVVTGTSSVVPPADPSILPSTPSCGRPLSTGLSAPPAPSPRSIHSHCAAARDSSEGSRSRTCRSRNARSSSWRWRASAATLRTVERR